MIMVVVVMVGVVTAVVVVLLVVVLAELGVLMVILFLKIHNRNIVPVLEDFHQINKIITLAKIVILFFFIYFIS